MSEDFDKIFGEGEFNENEIILDEMVSVIVPIFKSFVHRGLTVQEAAAMTAALISQGMPQPPVEPKED